MMMKLWLAVCAVVAVVVVVDGDLGLPLLRRLYGDGEEAVFSPVSLQMALGMALAGARGDTKEEIRSVVFDREPDARLHQRLGHFFHHARPNSSQYELAIANRLYGDLKFKHEFIRTCAKFYHGGISRVDFRKDTDAIRQNINKWVSKKTKDKIQNLIKPGVLSDLTRLVIVNAIYFKGSWLHKFNPGDTRREAFDVAPGQTKNVEMMHQTESFAYAETPDLQLLEMPYSNNSDMNMYVFLPKQKWGLKNLLSKLSSGDVEDLIAGSRPTRVMVSLPKWRVEVGLELSEELENLGLKTGLEKGRADFGAMGSGVGPGDVYISSVVQEVGLEVGEEGTEAAAASAAVVSRFLSAERRPLRFQANHPFAYLLAVDGHWLFLGVFQG